MSRCSVSDYRIPGSSPGHHGDRHHILVAVQHTAAPVALLAARLAELAVELAAELVRQVALPDVAVVAAAAQLTQTQHHPVGKSQGFPVLKSRRCFLAESHLSLER